MLSVWSCAVIVLVAISLIAILCYLHRYQARVKRHMAEADHLYAMVKDIHAKLVKQ